MKNSIQFFVISALALLPGCIPTISSESPAVATHADNSKDVQSSQITLIKDQEQFNKEVLGAKKPSVVKFFATWCGACKTMAPIIEEIAQELQGYTFFAIDVDKHRTIATEYDIDGIPALLLFKNGKLANKDKPIQGVMKKEALKNLITQY